MLRNIFFKKKYSDFFAFTSAGLPHLPVDAHIFAVILDDGFLPQVEARLRLQRALP